MDVRTRQPWWKGPRGEWWVAGQTALILALALTPPGWTWGGAPRRVLAVIGAALVVVGLAYAAAAIRALGPSLSPLPRPRHRAVLVQTGVYARVRHPVYGGLIVAAVGWALWRASGVHLALAGALALYLDAKARIEERWLLERFPDYAGYRARTRRLLPWLI
ncbi:MAG: isoprenylcysteine carboxylmethyltransferase family protein [Armatimonadota bacterium]|nr:isoprenylcysteine carboxylmethyltransferase family protein [Armatimonadota bacterium]